jgi:hypothetical protein
MFYDDDDAVRRWRLGFFLAGMVLSLALRLATVYYLLLVPLLAGRWHYSFWVALALGVMMRDHLTVYNFIVGGLIYSLAGYFLP